MSQKMIHLSFPNEQCYELEFFSTRKGVLGQHIAAIEKASRPVLDEIRCELNIPYGDRDREKIDVYGVDLDDEAPILVFVHGGQWLQQEQNRRQYAYIAGMFHRYGVKFISVGYELCPDVTFEYMISAMEKAANKCLGYAQEMGSKGVHFVGHCSGAYLISTLFTKYITTIPVQQQKMIKNAILIAGLYDLENIQKTTLNNILGLTVESAVQFSTLRQEISNGQGTKFHIFCATISSPEYAKQAIKLHEKLKAKKYYTRFQDINYKGHTDHYELIEHWNNDLFPIYRYVRQLIVDI